MSSLFFGDHPFADPTVFLCVDAEEAVKRAKEARELKDKLEVCCVSPEFQHDTILIQIQRERQEEFEHEDKRREVVEEAREVKEPKEKLEVCCCLPLFWQNGILTSSERESRQEPTRKARGTRKEELATTPASQPPGPTPPMTTAEVPSAPRPEDTNGMSSPSYHDLPPVTSRDRMVLLLLVLLFLLLLLLQLFLVLLLLLLLALLVLVMLFLLLLPVPLPLKDV